MCMGVLFAEIVYGGGGGGSEAVFRAAVEAVGLRGFDAFQNATLVGWSGDYWVQLGLELEVVTE